jgi:hypothetical protein
VPNRNDHVGKSREEKDSYKRALNVSIPANPTYEEETGDLTDTPSPRNSPDKIIPSALQTYKRDSNIPWKDIIIGVVVAIIGTFFIKITLDLNREVGVLDEKNKNETQCVQENKTDIKTNASAITSMQTDIEVLKNTKKDK